MTKLIKIGTKSQADSVLVESLFKAGETLQTMRFDMGKYKAYVSLIGREVQCSDDVYAIYQVSRRDGDGPYRALMCVCA
jgi:hypothetical protein